MRYGLIDLLIAAACLGIGGVLGQLPVRYFTSEWPYAFGVYKRMEKPDRK